MSSKCAPLDLAAWDAEAKSKSADYEKLYQSMMKAQKELTVTTDDKALEIWWRLAKATFMLTYNYIYEGAGYYEAIKNKADEASRYASKAVAIQADHFEANIWLAKSAAKVSQLELDAIKQIQSFKAFLSALVTCISLKPDEPRVLFLEGRLQLMLLTMSDEHKAAITGNVALPDQNLPLAESKLRKALQQQPTVPGHMILALILLELDKFAEVKQVVEKGLALERNTRVDEYAANQLEKVKAFLAEEAKQGKGGPVALVNPKNV